LIKKRKAAKIAAFLTLGIRNLFVTGFAGFSPHREDYSCGLKPAKPNRSKNFRKIADFSMAPRNKEGQLLVFITKCGHLFEARQPPIAWL
jgi:hypothetical protein